MEGISHSSLDEKIEWMSKKGHLLLYSPKILMWEQWLELNEVSRDVFSALKGAELKKHAQEGIFDIRMKVLERGLLNLHAHLNNQTDPQYAVAFLWIRRILCDFDPLDELGKMKGRGCKSGLELNSRFCIDQTRVERFIDRVGIALTVLQPTTQFHELYEIIARCRIPQRGVLRESYLRFISCVNAHTLIHHILSEVQDLSELLTEPWYFCRSTSLLNTECQQQYQQIVFDTFGVTRDSSLVAGESREELVCRIERFLLNTYGRT